jgi:hypothetical protein
MRVALIIACALALAVAFVIAVGGDDEDEAVIDTTPVTTTEAEPEPEPEPTTQEEPAEPEPADPDAPTNGHGGAEAPLKCGRIAFEPNTDSGASGIEANGTDCATARAVARGAHARRLGPRASCRAQGRPERVGGAGGCGALSGCDARCSC